MFMERHHCLCIQTLLETLIFIATAVTFIAMTIGTLWHLRWVRALPALDGLGASQKRIRCSVVIAARDEEARIEQTIRHLFAQRGLDAEFIVVDDRSTDRTNAILRRLAQDDARLQVKRVDVLPDGWLGKCHACHIGAAAATGDWILFTDADCWLKPDVIERAVRLAEREEADHVTMSPGTVAQSFGARAWQLLFLTSLVNWFSGVNRDRAKSFMGIGAFNLVRTAAYRQCGGYEALRLTVVDDMKLGLLLRRGGKKSRAFLGVEDVQCHWGDTVGNMVKIMEKNFFAAMDYRHWIALAGSMFVIFVFSILVFALMSGRTIGWIAAFSPFLMILPAGILARRLGWPGPCAILMPFMFIVFLYALLNSTFVTLRQGGIRWRETFYPLEKLRAGNVQ
jgi:cellulose synthase/poly-beta-1,6-N-acetylglucosamine synthase-like glycosyltransferase